MIFIEKDRYTDVDVRVQVRKSLPRVTLVGHTNQDIVLV